MESDDQRTNNVRKPKVGRPPKQKGPGRPKNRHRSFRLAKQFVHRQKFKTMDEWLNFARTSPKCPHDIPVRPDLAYPDRWEGWPDWLGCIPPSFEEAKELVRPLGLKSKHEWHEAYPTLELNLPKCPDHYYDEWISWADWLGVEKCVVEYKMNPNSLDNLRPYEKATHYRPFMEAVKFVSKLGLRDHPEWLKWRSKYPHSDLPWRPDEVYDKEWQGWSIFLGHDPLPGLLENVSVLFVAKHASDPANVYRIEIETMGRSALVHRANQEQFKVVRMWKYDPYLREDVRQVLAMNTSSWYGSDQVFVVQNIFGLFADLFNLLPVIS